MKTKYKKWDLYLRKKFYSDLLVFKQLKYSLREYCQDLNKARLIKRIDNRVLHLLKKGLLDPDDETLNKFIFNEIMKLPETDKEKEYSKRSIEATKSLCKRKIED